MADISTEKTGDINSEKLQRRIDWWTKWSEENKEDSKKIGLMIATKEHQATHDPLTKLPNRRGFIEKTEEILGILREVTEKVIASGGTEGEAVALSGVGKYKLKVFDLVGLHQKNETISHQAGDDALISVAEALLTVHTKKTHVVARIGGDEFVVFSVNETQDESKKINEELEKLLGKTDDRVNIVVAEFDRRVELSEALGKAEDEMKNAKKVGPVDSDGRSLGFAPVFIEID